MIHNQACVWVLEMLLDDRWLVTDYIYHSRIEARMRMRQWREEDPEDSIRISKYVRERERAK